MFQYKYNKAVLFLGQIYNLPKHIQFIMQKIFSTATFPSKYNAFPTIARHGFIKILVSIIYINQLKMRVKFIIITLIFCLKFIVFVNYANAQATTVTGPSDGTSNPPASASVVNQVVSSGSSISLKIGSSSTATDIIYQWYKLDNSGVKRLVQSGSNGTLTETAAGSGYYTYQLVMSNSNQCTSDISDPFKVYVLPALSPTITATNSTICSNGSSSSVLTTNPGSNKYSYLYQWAMNGNSISGATSATYTTTTNASGSNTYSVVISYALNTNYTGTANQVINAISVPNKPTISVGQ